MRLITIAGLITVILSLAACSSSRYRFNPPVNPGASVQVNHAYPSLNNGGKVYFQQGRQIFKGNIDRWETHCELYVYNPDQGADYVTSIQAGRFKVTRVGSNTERVEMKNFAAGVQVASLKWHTHDRPSFITYTTALSLQSDQQPDVRALNCYRSVSAIRTDVSHHPDLTQIRGALGTFVEIQLNSI